MCRALSTGPNVSVSELRILSKFDALHIIFSHLTSTCYNHNDLTKITIRETNPFGPRKLVARARTYNIPRDLLSWHSSYFAAALDPASDFHKDCTNEIVLEEDIATFDAFYCWLYTSRLTDPPIANDSVTVDVMYLSPSLLCKIWIFADMRGIPALGNAAIDMYHERIAASWSTNTHIIPFIYENTSKGALLRKMAIDSITLTKEFSYWLEPMESKLDVEFLLEAIPVLARRGDQSKSIGRAKWIALNRCVLHDHGGPGGRFREVGRQ
jgi:hypothetical protein